MPSKLFCAYFQAHVKPNMGWFVVAALKSFDHLCFDRTIDVERSIFEFYVPEQYEKTFLGIMAWMEKEGYVSGVVKMENRLLNPSTQI